MKYIVVGAGLSGAVIARYLAEKGKKVCVWDRREHIGGNMYDYVDEHGILVHKYGPHTFHTTKEYLFKYMTQFAEWVPYKLTCMAEINGKFTPTPFNFQTIDDYYEANDGAYLKKCIKEVFGDRTTATVVEVLQCKNETVRKYAEFLFEHDYSLYTAKQWGISPRKVDPSILKRVPLRFSYEIGYFDDEWQVMPKVSYTEFFKSIFDHPNIKVQLGIEALDHLSISMDGTYLLLDGEACPAIVIYTGALDELFANDEGALPYRSLRFEWKYENIESKQPAPVVAYPQAEGYTRITEYKKIPAQNATGTTYAIEYPLQYEAGKKQEPYYPLLTEESQILAEKYKARAKKIQNFYFCGRLADFKYYNMDQALDQALNICKEIEL